jgi:hypothetical protein
MIPFGYIGVIDRPIFAVASFLFFLFFYFAREMSRCPTRIKMSIARRDIFFFLIRTSLMRHSSLSLAFFSPFFLPLQRNEHEKDLTWNDSFVWCIGIIKAPLFARALLFAFFFFSTATSKSERKRASLGNSLYFFGNVQGGLSS